MPTLRGMTWDHSRGYTPMIATAQRYHDQHPDVTIVWEARSLQAFADQPIAALAEAYDLLVIDHPWAGFAASSGVLAPFDAHLSADYLADQAANTVGPSHASYQYADHQWALAIDAATPVAAWRPDLLERAGIAPPQTWEEVIALGRRGLVGCPSIPLDVFCNFVNLVASSGAALFADPETVTTREAGRAALERLAELADVVPADFYYLNPIRSLERLSTQDGIAYLPYSYGYSNYARDGQVPHLLSFGDPPALAPNQAPRTMLGGTGLAISERCQAIDVAMDYARFVAAPATQRGLYVQAGGQPGHRSAWLNDEVNHLCHNYFSDTLPALDRAFLRPRYDGYLDFQDHAGNPLYAWLRAGGRGSADAVLDTVDAMYRESQGRVR